MSGKHRLVGRPKGVVRLGLLGYAAILRRLQQDPMTTAQLCEAFCAKDGVFMRRILVKMAQLGLIHRASWSKPSQHASFVPVWRAGHGEDAPCPNKRVQQRDDSLRHNRIPLLLSFAAFIDAVEVPRTRSAIAEECELAEGTVSRLVGYANEIGLIFIARWTRSVRGGEPTPSFALRLFSERDAPRPTPFTDREAHERYEQRKLMKTMVGMARHPAAKGNQPGGAT